MLIVFLAVPCNSFCQFAAGDGRFLPRHGVTHAEMLADAKAKMTVFSILVST